MSVQELDPTLSNPGTEAVLVPSVPLTTEELSPPAILPEQTSQDVPPAPNPDLGAAALASVEPGRNASLADRLKRNRGMRTAIALIAATTIFLTASAEEENTSTKPLELTSYGQEIQNQAGRLAAGEKLDTNLFTWGVQDYSRDRSDDVIKEITDKVDDAAVKTGESDDKNKAAVACVVAASAQKFRSRVLRIPHLMADVPTQVVTQIRAGAMSPDALAKKGYKEYRKGDYGTAATYCSVSGRWTIAPPIYEVNNDANTARKLTNNPDAQRMDDLSVVPYPKGLKER